MGNLTVAFTFVWILNVLVALSQAAVIDMGPSEPMRFYNCSGTVIQTYSADGNCEQIIIPNTNSINSELPVTVKEVDDVAGFGFLDSISTAKNWFTNKLSYIGAILSGPYTIIRSIPGLPDFFVGVIAVFWYGISLYLLFAFIVGREA